MRRWKRIETGAFDKDDILVLYEDDDTSVPQMKRMSDGYRSYANTTLMVEIDDKGNTIRTYKDGDKLNEGTLVGGTMNKDEAMKRLEAIEKETAELKKIIETPDRLVFDKTKIYVTNRFDGYGPFFIHGRYSEAFYIVIGFTESDARWTFPTKTGQETIQHMIDAGYEVHEFSNQKDALAYMLSQCGSN